MGIRDSKSKKANGITTNHMKIIKFFSDKNKQEQEQESETEPESTSQNFGGITEAFVDIEPLLAVRSFAKKRKNDEIESQNDFIPKKMMNIHSKGQKLPETLGEQIFEESVDRLSLSVLSTTSLLLLTFAWFRAAEFLFEGITMRVFGNSSQYAKNPVAIAAVTTMIILIGHHYIKKNHEEFYEKIDENNLVKKLHKVLRK